MFINNNSIEISRFDYGRPRAQMETTIYTARDRNFTSPDEYHMAETYRNKQDLQREEYLVHLTQKSSTSRIKHKKEPKINLEFLKCYWKKDYQQLSKCIRNEHLKVDKELPFLVTSYTKDCKNEQRLTDRSLQVRKIEDNMSPQPGKPTTELKYVDTDSTRLLQFGHIKYREQITFKRIEKCKKEEIKLQTNTLTLQKRTPDEESVSKQKSVGHIFKGSNLKLKKNMYKNLETLMEQNNVFYLKYKPLGVSKFHQTRHQDSESRQPSFMTRRTQEDVPVKQRVTLTPLVETRMTELVNSRKSATAAVDSEPEVLQWEFRCCQLRQVFVQQRATNKPSMILVLHVEGLLTVHKEAFFGFQQDSINQQQLHDQQTQFLKHFIPLPERDSEFNVCYIYKQLKEVLKNLSRAYLIVLVFPEQSRLLDTVRRHLLEKKIHFDAIYTVEQRECFVTDYATVLQDFHINVPKRLVLIRPIEQDDGETLQVDGTTKAHTHFQFSPTMMKLKLESFGKNIKMLSVAHLPGTYRRLQDGIFPKAPFCDLNNQRLVLVPKLTYRKLIEHIKLHEIPSLEAVEQVALALMNEFSFLNLVHKHKNVFYRLSFTDQIKRFQEDQYHQHQRCVTQKLALGKLMAEARVELEHDSEVYVQEDTDYSILENRRRVAGDLQQRVLRQVRKTRNKKPLSEEQAEDIVQKVAMMVDDLYSKNKNIIRKVSRLRSQMKMRVGEYFTAPSGEPPEPVQQSEFEFCKQFEGVSLYHNIFQS